MLKILSPFQSRNFRLYFVGQWFSLTGSWMTNTALVWLVFEITGSPLWLAMIGLASQFPAVALGPFAGVLIDRVHRVRLMIFLQCLSMIHAIALTALAFGGATNVWLYLALALFHGLIVAVDAPTRQSMSVMLADDRKDLAGVIALNASMFHFARLVGPALAGVVISIFGTAICFAADAASYLIVLGALVALRFPKSTDARVGAKSSKKVFQQLCEGIRYAYQFFPIRIHILLSGLTAMLVLSYATLMPVYGTRFFDGNARTLGWMMSCTAAGALAGALYLAGRKRIPGIGSVIITGLLMSGASLWAFAWNRNFLIACILLTIAGAGGILVMASNNTLVQTLVDDDKRGRVMSLYTMIFFGGFPLGGLFNGWLATKFDPMIVPMWCGTCAILLMLAFAFLRPRLHSEVRPILIRAESHAAPGA